MPNYVVDGNSTFLAGQNAARDPSQVSPAGYYSGINVNIQKGVLSPRWGFSEVDPIFLTNGGVTLPNFTTRSYETIFRSGRFQALIPYVVGNTFYLIVIISGIIYCINQDSREVITLSVADGSMLDERAPRINWSAAGRFLVLFDYPAYPVIIEGLNARRANPLLSEVPISVLGSYNQNRLFISNAGNEFTAGDPSGSIATPDAPITFFEVEQSGSAFFGQIFQLPTNYNNNQITAMPFLQAVDTSTGIGPLLISTQKEIYAYNTQLSRIQWEQGPFGSLIVFNAGIAGPRSFTNVNSDLFFMSNDGEVRPLSMSRDEQKRWSKVPISREVQNWLTFYDKNLTSYAVLGYFKNKIFVTANPLRVPAFDTKGSVITDIAHAGFTVLELDSVSTMTDQSPPAWCGVWTGIRPMDMCNNNDRCFVMSKDSSFINNLYEITPEKTYDVINGKTRYVRSRVYTKEYDFQSPFINKEVHAIDVGLTNVQGDFELNVEYKPVQAFEYIPWRTFKHKAPWRACDMPEGCEFNGFAPHQFREVNLGSPDDANECNPITRENYSLFKELQLKLTITGKYWEIKNFAIMAVPKAQNQTESICNEYPKVEVCNPCNDDWKTEGLDLCQQLET